MIKIAVSGKLGSGKDLFFKYAQKEYPHLNFINKKFAQPIYDVVTNIQNTLYVPRVKDGKLLQFIGEHYRETYPDIWVDTFFATAYNPDNNTIITDVRYPNELETCKRFGFVTVRILRKEELRLNNLGNRDVDHESEIALDTTSNTAFDYIINNNGTLDLYQGAISHIIEQTLNNTRRVA